MWQEVHPVRVFMFKFCSFPGNTNTQGHKSTHSQRNPASVGSELQTETMHVIIIANYTRGRTKTVGRCEPTGLWEERAFDMRKCLLSMAAWSGGLHTSFQGRKWKLREIRWLGQGHTAWKWQNLTFMTPRNKLSILASGSLRLGLKEKHGRWDCGGEVGGIVFREKLREKKNRGFTFGGSDIQEMRS